LFLWLTTPTPGVSLANFHRLRFGMSPRDVEALLGEPCRVAEHREGSIRLWRGEEIEIRLVFEADGLEFGDADRLAVGIAQNWETATPTDHVEYLRPYESLLDRIRRLLHL
jgi:hypothetical protein